jgi:hypothetical protein
MGTITMFHVGAVFLTVGLFLMLAAVITSETNKAEIAELIGTGVVCLVIGIFLVILNRFYGQREEEELQNYVESRLARTRSGQRLYHETDSYPDHLDSNCSKTPSMESGLSNDFPSSGKKKKGNKNKPAPASTVNIINENNHHQNKNNLRGPTSSSGNGGIEEISPSGVTLDRINEEARQNASTSAYHHQSMNNAGGRQQQNASSAYYSNEDPSGTSRGGNLYRVYDTTT